MNICSSLPLQLLEGEGGGVSLHRVRRKTASIFGFRTFLFPYKFRQKTRAGEREKSQEARTMPAAGTRGIFIDVHVALLDGRTLKLNLDQESTVAEVKARLQTLSGILPEIVVLRFEDQTMTDEMVLVEVGVCAHDVLRVALTERQQARVSLQQRGVGDSDLDFINASRDGDVEVLEWLLAVGVSPCECDPMGNSAAMHAASNSNLVALQVLLNAGADVDHRGMRGETAAMWAAAQGHVEAVEFLSGAGADLTLADEDGDTALMWAASNARIEAVRLLSLHGDWRAERNVDGWNARDHAVEEKHQVVVDFFDSL